MRHLAASEITARLPAGQVAAVAERLRSTGLTEPVAEDGDLHLSVPRPHVPAVLGLLAGADAQDITCTPARLEDLFLRHYEVMVR
jgi:ABC-2 type transport system ATP-binding protein